MHRLGRHRHIALQNGDAEFPGYDQGNQYGLVMGHHINSDAYPYFPAGSYISTVKNGHNRDNAGYWPDSGPIKLWGAYDGFQPPRKWDIGTDDVFLEDDGRIRSIDNWIGTLGWQCLEADSATAGSKLHWKPCNHHRDDRQLWTWTEPLTLEQCGTSPFNRMEACAKNETSAEKRLHNC